MKEKFILDIHHGIHAPSAGLVRCFYSVECSQQGLNNMTRKQEMVRIYLRWPHPHFQCDFFLNALQFQRTKSKAESSRRPSVQGLRLSYFLQGDMTQSCKGKGKECIVFKVFCIIVTK